MWTEVVAEEKENRNVKLIESIHGEIVSRGYRNEIEYINKRRFNFLACLDICSMLNN